MVQGPIPMFFGDRSLYPDGRPGYIWTQIHLPCLAVFQRGTRISSSFNQSKNVSLLNVSFSNWFLLSSAEDLLKRENPIFSRVYTAREIRKFPPPTLLGQGGILYIIWLSAARRLTDGAVPRTAPPVFPLAPPPVAISAYRSAHVIAVGDGVK